MSAAELAKTKSELIDWIEHLSDVNMLNVLEGLKKTEADDDWWDTLPPGHQQQINTGIEQGKAGKILSSPQFWNLLKNG